MERRVESLEERQERVDSAIRVLSDRIHKLETDQAETKVYIKMILDNINELKNLIGVGVKSAGASPNQQQWFDLVKWIIGGTIFLIVANIFTKGG